MAIFSKEKKKKGGDSQLRSAQDTKSVSQKRTTEKKSKDESSLSLIKDVKKDIILKPWITEKAHGLMSLNKYIFKVDGRSTKKQIKKAIEAMYNVKVKEVKIINIPAKKRIYGRSIGRKPGYKKAILSLKAGDKIELFKGV